MVPRYSSLQFASGGGLVDRVCVASFGVLEVSVLFL